MTEPLLRVDELTKAFGGLIATDRLSLDIAAGEIHAIMGPNGSGKSTLSYILAGREGYEITGGRIIFEGEDLTGRRFASVRFIDRFELVDGLIAKHHVWNDLGVDAGEDG